MARQLLRFTGLDGVGISLLGEIFTSAKIKSGGYGLTTTTHTSEVTNGPIVLDITLDDEETFHPYENYDGIDFMLSISQVSFDAFKHGVKEGGTIVIDPNFISINSEDRLKWNIIEIAIVSIAEDEVGNIITQSIVSLAITNCFTNVLDKDILEQEMLINVDKEFNKINKEAYDLGYKYAQRILSL